MALKPKELKPKETKPNEYGDYFLNKLSEIKNFPKIDFNNLKYTFKDRNNSPIIFKRIYNGNITLEDVEKDQIKVNQTLATSDSKIQKIGQTSKIMQ